MGGITCYAENVIEIYKENVYQVFGTTEGLKVCVFCLNDCDVVLRHNGRRVPTSCQVKILLCYMFSMPVICLNEVLRCNENA